MLFNQEILNGFLAIILIGSVQADASWWLLGMQSPVVLQNASSVTQRTSCERLHYLVARQRELCALDRSILQCVGDGVRAGINECQHQFRNYLWNCTTYSNSSSVFGGITAVKSREAAYIHAISAAGVAYSVTRYCSRGQISECGCDRGVVSRRSTDWQWGGCSEDVDFGRKFSEQFVDSNEDGKTAHGLMNLHNNNVGRKEIKGSMMRLCKCHGISGSCNVQICWRKMAPFRQIGDKLRVKFDRAALVQPVRRRRRLRLKPKYSRRKRASKRKLIYLADSPKFCSQDSRLGIAGTAGRECNATSWGSDGCKLLCCGRGWRSETRHVTDKCHCRFIYCCRVECRTCNRTLQQHFCN